MAISSKLALKFFFFNTVHNLIYFSMVFTNKNRGGGTIITKVYLPLTITKVKYKTKQNKVNILNINKTKRVPALMKISMNLCPPCSAPHSIVSPSLHRANQL